MKIARFRVRLQRITGNTGLLSIFFYTLHTFKYVYCTRTFIVRNFCMAYKFYVEIDCWNRTLRSGPMRTKFSDTIRDAGYKAFAHEETDTTQNRRTSRFPDHALESTAARQGSRKDASKNIFMNSGRGNRYKTWIRQSRYSPIVCFLGLLRIISLCADFGFTRDEIKVPFFPLLPSGRKICAQPTNHKLNGLQKPGGGGGNLSFQDTGLCHSYRKSTTHKSGKLSQKYTHKSGEISQKYTHKSGEFLKIIPINPGMPKKAHQ